MRLEACAWFVGTSRLAPRTEHDQRLLSRDPWCVWGGLFSISGDVWAWGCLGYGTAGAWGSRALGCRGTQGGGQRGGGSLGVLASAGTELIFFVVALHGVFGGGGGVGGVLPHIQQSQRQPAPSRPRHWPSPRLSPSATAGAPLG